MFSSAFVYVRLSPYLDLVMDTRLMSVLRPGILVTWSPGDIDVGIQASLIQIYPILLSTLLSINSQTLDLYDASYALLLTSSPLTVYLAVASICDLFGFETDLYKRIKFHRRTIRTLGALIPFLWLGLSVTLRFSDRAFVNSDLCRGSSFKGWMSDLYQAFMVSVLSVRCQILGLVLLPVFGLAFGLCLFRRWSQVTEDFRADREREPKLWGVVRIPWTFVKCAWCVSVVAPNQLNLTRSRRTVGRNHNWCVCPLLVYFDYNWASRVITSASHPGYVLSYGQVRLPLRSIDCRIPIKSPRI
jgi:hypothetical protein